MKLLRILILLSLIGIGLFSCKKDIKPQNRSLAGNWMLKSDSVFIAGEGNSNSTYHAKSPEYFNFGADGILRFYNHYIPGPDSIRYSITSDSTVVIAYALGNPDKGLFFSNGQFKITELTTGAAALYSIKISLPPGSGDTSGELIKLQK
jgi:hypothetical protein